jgi:hypothetical protein
MAIARHAWRRHIGRPPPDEFEARPALLLSVFA